MNKIATALLSFALLSSTGCSNIKSLESQVADLQEDVETHKAQNEELRAELNGSSEHVHYLCAAIFEMATESFYVGDYTFYNKEGKAISYGDLDEECLSGLSDYKNAVKQRKGGFSSSGL